MRKRKHNILHAPSIHAMIQPLSNEMLLWVIKSATDALR